MTVRASGDECWCSYAQRSEHKTAGVARTPAALYALSVELQDLKRAPRPLYWNTMTACGECIERRWFQYLRSRCLPRAGHIENFVSTDKGSEMAQNQEQSPAKKCQGATFTVGGYSYKIGKIMFNIYYCIKWDSDIFLAG